MSLAPYYDRTAIALSQVVAGFDADAFADELNKTSVGVSFSTDDLASPQGLACADLVVRLLARIYPKLALTGSPDQNSENIEALKELARSINPRIELVDSASIGIAIGAGSSWARTVHAGSTAWSGSVSTEDRLKVGSDDVPFGAGVAACLAVSAVFRMLFLAESGPIVGALPVFEPGTEPDLSAAPFELDAMSALVGTGAIGQAALWALRRSPVTGQMHCVDGETFDIGNLQRYVLTTVDDVDKSKANFAADFLNMGDTAERLRGIAVDKHWPDAVDLHGSTWMNVIVAVDSADARHEAQATLPNWIANGWTQAGDLGVSEHDFLGGACVSCLYLPLTGSKSEDEIIATALGVRERKDQVRDLLYRGSPAPAELLELIAARLGIDPQSMASFQGRALRELYVDGICGGALVKLGSAVDPVHVPLAHQSALAGVLLAARLVRRASGYAPTATEVCRVDVRRNPPDVPFQNAGKDPRGICICQDPDYVAAYRHIWS